MPSENSPSPSVLVVEDEPRIRELLQDTLIKKGFSVSTARNGHLGFEKYEKEQPHILITDLMLPRMDGFELVEKVRKTPHGRDIPIIMMSAVYKDAKVKEKVLKMFRVDFLVKPFSLVDFLKKLHNASLVTLVKEESNQEKYWVSKQLKFDERVKQIGFSPEEMDLILKINGRRSVRELLMLSRGKIQNFFQILWALLFIEAVEIKEKQ